MHPSPPPPPARHTHLAWAAVDAVFYLFHASMWLLFWGLATKEIGRLACGEGCAVVTAADKAISVALGVTIVLTFPFIGLLLTAAEAPVAVATATDTEATKEPAPETSSYAAVRDKLCDSLILGLIPSLAFTLLLMLIGLLVKGDSPMMGSRRERMGSVIFDVGSMGTVMVSCFVLCPIMTVRNWRAWGMVRAWRKTRHAL